jgi:hypothetical protein
MAGVAYFILGTGERWAVIKLYPDDREEIVRDGLSLAEAEEFCIAKLENIAPAAPAVGEGLLVEDVAPRRRRGRQLAFKF